MIAPATPVQRDIRLSSSSILYAGLSFATHRTAHAQVILAYLGPVLDMVQQAGTSPEKTQAYWAMCMIINIKSHNIFNIMLFEHMLTKLLKGLETRVTHIAIITASRGSHLSD